MTIITIICIIITITVVILTSWYRNGKNRELLEAQAKGESANFYYNRVCSRHDVEKKYLRRVVADLHIERDETYSSNRMYKEENEELRENLKKLSDELGLRHKLKAIKFTANVPLNGWTKTEFKLGVGPCGLTVDRLKWVELDDRYILTQYHSDGSRKEFEYLKDDIKGHIEKYLND